MASELLFVCKNAAGGCGYVGPRTSWTSVGDTLQMCPSCFRDHAFAVDLENVHRLSEWGMDPEPVRSLLEEVEELEDVDDNYQEENGSCEIDCTSEDFFEGSEEEHQTQYKIDFPGKQSLAGYRSSPGGGHD